MHRFISFMAELECKSSDKRIYICCVKLCFWINLKYRNPGVSTSMIDSQGKIWGKISQNILYKIREISTIEIRKKKKKNLQMFIPVFPAKFRVLLRWNFSPPYWSGLMQRNFFKFTIFTYITTSVFLLKNKFF